MKKIIGIVLVAVLGLGLVGCGSKKPVNDKKEIESVLKSKGLSLGCNTEVQDDGIVRAFCVYQNSKLAIQYSYEPKTTHEIKSITGIDNDISYVIESSTRSYSLDMLSNSFATYDYETKEYSLDNLTSKDRKEELKNFKDVALERVDKLGVDTNSVFNLLSEKAEKCYKDNYPNDK